MVLLIRLSEWLLSPEGAHLWLTHPSLFLNLKKNWSDWETSKNTNCQYYQSYCIWSPIFWDSQISKLLLNFADCSYLSRAPASFWVWESIHVRDHWFSCCSSQGSWCIANLLSPWQNWAGCQKFSTQEEQRVSKLPLNFPTGFLLHRDARWCIDFRFQPMYKFYGFWNTIHSKTLAIPTTARYQFNSHWHQVLANYWESLFQPDMLMIVSFHWDQAIVDSLVPSVHLDCLFGCIADSTSSGFQKLPVFLCSTNGCRTGSAPSGSASCWAGARTSRNLNLNQVTLKKEDCLTQLRTLAIIYITLVRLCFDPRSSWNWFCLS